MKRVIPKRRQASRPYSPPKSEDSQDDYFLSPTSTLSNGSSLESASSFKSTTNSDTVKIKAYFLDCRIIKCDKSITFSELKRKLREKFKESRLRFKYKDGNTMAVMHNDDDLLEAIGDAKVIELFCYLPSG